MRAALPGRTLAGVAHHQRVVLDLETETEQITGSIASEETGWRPFYGWLELIAALDSARAQTDGGHDEGSPTQNPGLGRGPSEAPRSQVAPETSHHGIDNTEIIHAVHERPAPMIPASTRLAYRR